MLTQGNNVVESTIADLRALSWCVSNFGLGLESNLEMIFDSKIISCEQKTCVCEPIYTSTSMEGKELALVVKKKNPFTRVIFVICYPACMYFPSF